MWYLPIRLFIKTMNFNPGSPFEVLVLQPLYTAGWILLPIRFFNFTALTDFEKQPSSCEVSWSGQFHQISPQYLIGCFNNASYFQIWMLPQLSNQPYIVSEKPSRHWPDIEGDTILPQQVTDLKTKYWKRLGKVTHYVSRLLSGVGRTCKPE